jgi:hypothetical protein
MTHHTTPTLLEVASYLTDTTFVSFVALTFSVFIALEVVNRIGGAK